MKLKSPNNLAFNEAVKSFNESLFEEQKSQIDSLTKKIDELKNIIYSRNNVIVEQSRNLSSKNEIIKHQQESLRRKNAIIKKKRALIKELRTEVNERITKQVAVFNENQELEEKASKYANFLADAHDELRELNALIQGKDEVIDDLGKELSHKDKLIAWVKDASKGYCNYGVSANDFIKLLSKEYVLLSKREADVNVELLEKCKMYQLYGFPGNYSKSKEE